MKKIQVFMAQKNQLKNQVNLGWKVNIDGQAYSASKHMF